MKTTSLLFASLTTIFLTTLLVGCGGGGGSGGGTTSPSTKIITINNGTLRSYLPADSISYKATYNGSYDDGSGKVNEQGTLSRTFSSTSFSIAGAPSLLAVADEFTSGASVATSFTYIAQDALGNLSIYADSDGYFHNGTTGALYTQSPLGVGISWMNKYDSINPNVLSFGIRINPNHVQETFSVVSKETVVTPLGSFEAFKLVYTISSVPDDISSFLSTDESGAMWIYPPIGIIKQQYTHIEHDAGGDYTLVSTSTITATNIPF